MKASGLGFVQHCFAPVFVDAVGGNQFCRAGSGDVVFTGAA